MDEKQKSNFAVGDKVVSVYTDAIGHSSTMYGTIRSGPIDGTNDIYWYVAMGGVAVLFAEKDLQHA